MEGSSTVQGRGRPRKTIGQALDKELLLRFKWFVPKHYCIGNEGVIVVSAI